MDNFKREIQKLEMLLAIRSFFGALILQITMFKIHLRNEGSLYVW